MKAFANTLIYALLYAVVRLHALLPMAALYVLSDAFYVLIYRLVGYRRRVVRSNLEGAFPHLSPDERLRLERRFYHHFSDYIVETIKLAGISHEELLRRRWSARCSKPAISRSSSSWATTAIGNGSPDFLRVLVGC